MLAKLIAIITSIFLTIAPMSEYTEGVVGQPDSFLPHQATKQNDRTISKLLYRGLFRYDIYGSLENDLVKSWEISEDGLVYTITLKDNQHWSDGTEINSDDVIYTAFKSPELSTVATDKVDDKTIRFTLPNKFSPFRSLLTTGIMQKNTEEEQNKLRPITSGQFKVINIKRSGPLVKEVTLYNRGSQGDIKKLSFRYYVNEEELVTAAELGEIDAFLADSTHELNNFTNYRFPIQSVYYSLFFNLRSDNFSDVEFRKKLRNSLPVKELTADYGIPVEGPISKSSYTEESIQSTYFDSELSEEVIEKSITITVPDIEKHRQLAKQIEHVWEDKFNIAVEVAAVNSDTIMEDVIKPRDFEVLLYGQQVGRDPDRYVHWHSTQTEHPGLNISGFSHVRADRALEEGRNVVKFEERLTHYHEFQKVIEEQVPVIFMYHPFKNYYVSDDIEGIGEKYTFTLGDRFLDFNNWKIPLEI